MGYFRKAYDKSVKVKPSKKKKDDKPKTDRKAIKVILETYRKAA